MKALLFQGQGGFHPEVLRELCARPQLADYVRRAEAEVRSLLGVEFSSWMTQEKPPEEAALEQIGIFLEGFLSAQVLLENGVQPDLAMGHSFGEFCALAVAGAISFEDGIRLICGRLRALEGLEQAGGMAAVSADVDGVGQLFAALPGHGLEISVINHGRQTVVSGPVADLERLTREATGRGIGVTRLASRFPFHSSRLAGARQRFAEMARSVRFGPARFGVYLPIEGITYHEGLQMPELLASHLVTRFDFRRAVESLLDRGVRSLFECGGGTMLRNIVRRILEQWEGKVELGGLSDYLKASSHASAAPAAGAQTIGIDKEVPAMEPIAIIGFGSVLPGATDSEKYWAATQNGVCGIYNYDRVDLDFRTDCFSEGPIKVNKTYSLLCGTITNEAINEAAAHANVELPSGYAKIQKMLALAMHEALRSAELRRESPLLRDAHCYLGATPDGISEYDDALVLSHLERGVVSSLPPERREAAAADLHGVLGKGAPERFAPSVVYEQVMADSLPHGARVVLVDAACSSSLYAADLAAKSLAAGETDLAICGGAFAAGIGNNCMFAQFGGLARTAIRPLDEQAEGTVFCDGAVVLLLRRLRDAVRDRNPIHGVIRGIGLSSDGKAPAVNVPTSAGQGLAIERAYQGSGIDKESIQYVEAHATGTSGDAIEFTSLKQVFAARGAQLPRIRLGSNKVLIGHTGWASGASAIVKLLLAFKHHVIPAQHGLGEINRKFEIQSSPFEIPRTNLIWPPNLNNQPRRAAINSFGFGGTNAHLILEEYQAAHHAALASVSMPRRESAGCAIVGTSAIFPGSGRPSATPAGRLGFSGSDFALPPGKLLLPDIRDHMARAQYLAVMAADPLIAEALAKGVDASRIGVVITFNDKCERACAANLHIYRDRFLRLIRATPNSSDLDGAVTDWYRGFGAAHLPIGPYTLAGIMPNIITGRIANLYDLKGPNFVVGDSRANALSAVRIGQALVRSGDADLVLCGGLHLRNSPFEDAGEQEGIVLFAVTTEAFAIAHDLPACASMDLALRVAEPHPLRQAV